jgi:hypothetical protein
MAVLLKALHALSGADDGTLVGQRVATARWREYEPRWSWVRSGR